ncbi:MAG TPA: hypothetical protein VLS93_17805, partial [Anaeromyxobacteraceae bacterium]|nr:hypothetical protein [Anaeromyxobacteraceae bacterium]
MRRFAAAATAVALVLLPAGSGAQEPDPSASPPQAGAGPFARLLLLPDLSAVGSFALAWNGWDVGALSPRDGPYAPSPDEPAFLFEEVELAIQAAVDPYARADLFVALGPDGAAVEEAFLTTLGLPAGLQLRAGRIRSPFGRANPLHPHARDFLDAPLATERLLAPEALVGTGLSLGWLAPLPWYAELVVAGQSAAVEEDGPEALLGVARLSQYFSLGDAATLGVGLSGGLRDEGTGRHRDLFGADAYLRIRPPVGRSYLALTGEAVGRRLRGPGGGDAEWGGYAQAFWRAGPRFGLGARWDTAPTSPEGTARPGREHRWSALA